MKELSPGLDEQTLLSRYGWVVSVNPLGQMVASPVFGYLYQKTGSARLVGLITSLAYVLGNILYSILSVFPEDYRYPLLLFSRFIVGVSSGNIATIRKGLQTLNSQRSNISTQYLQWGADQTAHSHISLCKWGHFERAKSTLKRLLASWFLLYFFKRFRSLNAENLGSVD